METRICCAHNVTRGCSISSKVTVAHLALQPLKALKVLLNGLALDSESSLWLNPLLGAPMTLRLFPFDLLYLNAEMRVLEGVELLPNVPLPVFGREVASALILPLHRLSTSGTVNGDQVLICAEEELEAELNEIRMRLNPAPVPAAALPPEIVVAEVQAPVQGPVATPMPGPRISVPIRTKTATPGAGFTVSLNTTWQITSSTMAAAALPEMGPEESAILPVPTAPESQGAADPVHSVAEPASAPHFEPSVVTETLAKPAVAATTKNVPKAAMTPAGIHEVVANSAETQTNIGKPAEIPKPLVESVASVDAVPEAITALARAAGETIEIVELSEAETSAMEADTAEAAPPPISKMENLIARSKEAWEKARVTPSSPPAAANPEKEKKSTREERRDPLGTRVIRWLNLEDPLPERRKIIRLLLEGLQAYEANGDWTQRYELRDVCPTGFCLRTQKQWNRDEIISLVLEKKGATEKDREHRVRVPARVIRCDGDGVGFEFAFFEGTEFEPWKRAKSKRSDETEADFILRELRFASAVGFLSRLCPGGAEEIRHALLDRLSNKRVASAVDIALGAEEILARSGNVGKVLAHSDVVMRIIESGSWIEEGWIWQLWSGLLISSCSSNGQDRSNMPLIDVMARLTPLHLRVLSFVCSKGVEAITSGQAANALRLNFKGEELMEATDSHSFVRIEQTIGHLVDYGLLSEAARPSYVAMSDKKSTSAAPTALGLKMYARWHGKRA
jgi:hypothetical protein